MHNHHPSYRHHLSEMLLLLLLLLITNGRAAADGSMTVIKVNVGDPGALIPSTFYGNNLEMTRHDIFEGLSAEMVANRKFAAYPAGTSWPDVLARLAKNGLAGKIPRWTAVGNVTLDAPLWSLNSKLVFGDVGNSILCPGGAECGVQQSQWLDGSHSGQSYGSSIAMLAENEYLLRIWVRAGNRTRNNDDNATVVATISAGEHVWQTFFALPEASSGWTELRANASLAVTTSNASLRLTSTAHWWLGSVSLSPANGTWNYMRADVVEALKRLNMSGGLLRYPGGCFSSFYRWKVGLVDPPDLQPPIATPPSFCAAVKGGVNAYTDGALQNGLGIDNYMKLVEEVNATAAITVRVSLGDDNEIEEARDWVEYVNGGTDTKYGALRAKRGHPDPYNVSYFYLGVSCFSFYALFAGPNNNYFASKKERALAAALPPLSAQYFLHGRPIQRGIRENRRASYRCDAFSISAPAPTFDRHGQRSQRCFGLG